MRIAIIGAGFTGLTAGLRLVQQGHSVTIFEKENKPGGLALGFKKENWQWSLEEYYHHWFTNKDDSAIRLANEINYPVIITHPKTSVYVDGSVYQLDSPKRLLFFPKLSVVERLRMAGVLGFLRFNPYWKPLERYNASEFLKKFMGTHGYELLWEPQLINKFGRYANDISLAWFWSRINKRTSSLGYPQGGFLQFTEALAKKITQAGGIINYNIVIEKIMENKNEITIGKLGTFDKLIVTLPSFAFVHLFPQLPDDYKKRLTSLKGLAAQVLVLRLKEQFMTDGSYWLSVCDKNSPVMGIFEHTNFMNKKYYNNEHIVYLGNYMPKEDARFSLSSEELLQNFDPFLQKINKDYKKNLIGIEMFKAPFAQPIIPVNYSKMVPPFETPLKNVYLANMQQVYPWDRGTNYAVELGEKIAKIAGTI